MLASRKPLSNRDFDRLERVLARDLQSDPKPRYAPIDLDNLDTEERAAFDALSDTGKELTRLMADVLSDIRPRDRLLVLRFLVQAGENERRIRLIAKQDQNNLEEQFIDVATRPRA